MKFMTWNILSGADYAKEAEFIKQINPDIFVLQEISRNEAARYNNRQIDVYEELQKYFKDYQSVYAPINYKIENSKEISFGNAIFSRYPIKNSDIHYFFKAPHWTTNHQEQSRNLLVANILYSDKITLAVGTCHLTYEPYFKDTPKQIEEAEKIVHILNDEPYAILAGDFNSTPDSQVVSTIRKSFKEAENKNLTFARIPWGFNGFEVDSLQYKLDYIFHSPNIASSNIITPDCEYSDHLPIVADIII